MESSTFIPKVAVGPEELNQVLKTLEQGNAYQIKLNENDPNRRALLVVDAVENPPLVSYFDMSPGCRPLLDTALKNTISEYLVKQTGHAEIGNYFVDASLMRKREINKGFLFGHVPGMNIEDSRVNDQKALAIMVRYMEPLYKQHRGVAPAPEKP